MPDKLTSRERIMRIFRNEEYDRPSLKLWGSNYGMSALTPAYEPVCRLAEQITDIYSGAGSAFHIYCGKNCGKYMTQTTEDTDSHLWKNIITTAHTPDGELTQIDRVSTVGEPGYTMEHFIKEPDDLKKFLSMEYDPFEFSADGYFAEERRIGDRGITMFGLDHAGYALQRIMGSEMLAYMSVDERDLVHEAISTFTERLIFHTKQAIEHGIRGVYCWVGPELLIPPLMSDNDFTEFVYNYDKQICDLIHDAGGYVWVHCHGKVAKLIERFIGMGVDVLNPLEPPKNGDINLEEIVNKFGNRIGLEGNIEIQDILLEEPDNLINMIEACAAAGKKSGRFILCPSAGFMEYTHPSEKYINNLMLYLNEGLRILCE